MKSLKRRFEEMVRRNPYLSSYMCFYEAVRGQRFSRKVISRWFYKLVSADDYFVEDGMRGLLEHLYKESNPMEVKNDITTIKKNARGRHSAG